MNLSDPREHETFQDKAAQVRHVSVPRVGQVPPAATRQAEAPPDQEPHMQRVRVRQREQDAAGGPLPQEARRRQEELGPESVRRAEAVGQEGGPSTAAAAAMTTDH